MLCKSEYLKSFDAFLMTECFSLHCVAEQPRTNGEKLTMLVQCSLLYCIQSPIPYMSSQANFIYIDQNLPQRALTIFTAYGSLCAQTLDLERTKLLEEIGENLRKSKRGGQTCTRCCMHSADRINNSKMTLKMTCVLCVIACTSHSYSMWDT